MSVASAPIGGRPLGTAPGLAAALGSADAVLAHQPLHAVAIDVLDAVALEREVQLAIPVGAEVGPCR